MSESNFIRSIVGKDETERVVRLDRILRDVNVIATSDARVGAKICECAAEIALHFHPRTNDHYCDWCGGIASTPQMKLVHKKGICACPSACPRGSHMSRRCR